MPFDGSQFEKPRWTPWKIIRRLIGRAPVQTPKVFEMEPAPVIKHGEVHGLLTEARRLIAPKSRWLRGAYSNDKGQYCALGALQKAALQFESPFTYATAHDLLMKYVRSYSTMKDVPSFNDVYGHTAVLRMFEHAIARADKINPR
jgi:hypothetical protein